jgi:hypothetical protein
MWGISSTKCPQKSVQSALMLNVQMSISGSFRSKTILAPFVLLSRFSKIYGMQLPDVLALAMPGAATTVTLRDI